MSSDEYTRLCRLLHIYAVGVLVCERYLCGDGVGGGAGAAGQLLEGFLVKAHGVIAIEGHPDDGDGVQHVDYHGGHGQTEALHMESARAPHCHRAHQCREHWHREEQGEDKGDDRIRIPVPVEWVLVWIVQVDAVVIMRLVKLVLLLAVLKIMQMVREVHLRAV